MRVGLFGGSFDPIHRGHVAPVRAVRDRLGLDVVLFVVTARPPHKSGRRLAPARDRYAMVERALRDEPGLEASPLEMTADRPVYTIDTLERLEREWLALRGRCRSCGERISARLIIGADGLAALADWRRGAEIPRLVTVVVMARPGWDLAAVRSGLAPEIAAALESGRIRVVETPLVDLSASDLRERLASGERPGPDEIHPEVLDYILEHELYDDDPAPIV